MTKEIYFNSDGILVIDGKKYIPSKDKMKDIDGIKHIDKTLMIEFDEKDFNKKINHIANVLSKEIDKQELIKELVNKKPIHEINSLYKLFTESKVKSLKVQKGCIGIKINSGHPKTGGRYFQLVD
jgi:hypothetical protein